MLESKLFKYLFITSAILFCCNVFAFRPGNSAWLYGKKDEWVAEVIHFNQCHQPQHRINYLFPESGSVHIDSKNNKILMTYDPSVTSFYKKKLPNIIIMPDLSFWVAHTNFKDWSVDQYRVAAKKIVTQINHDDNADGVFLDLESYKPTLLPFYSSLVHGLKKHHKILSVIVRPGQENIPWFNSLGNNAFVVLYGYDLHESQDSHLPVSPIIYKKRLSDAVAHLLYVVQATHTPVMGGLPVIATTYEWEEKRVSGNQTQPFINSQYHQIDYLKSALSVYAELRSESYLGYSIWAFVSPSQSKMITYYPYEISSESWSLLGLARYQHHFDAP